MEAAYGAHDEVLRSLHVVGFSVCISKSRLQLLQVFDAFGGDH